MTGPTTTLDRNRAVDTHWTLPPLRAELKLYAGPTNADHTPTWTLHDPVLHRFFRLEWLDHLLLVHWPLCKVDLLIQTIEREAGVAITVSDIQEMIRFLSMHNLLQAHSRQAVQNLQEQYHAGKVGSGHWLLHHYLFFKIHLIRPDPLLRAMLPLVRFIYTRTFLLVLGVLGVLAIYLTARQWDTFSATFRYFLSLDGLLWYAATLVCVKIFHELGHAITACRLGCRIPSMGVAFMVLWPILYTDTSDAWKLRSRRARLAIGVAGIGTELVIAVLATLVWNFLPEGPARSSAVLLASVTWITSMIINLNPFMRFDGYYLLADLLGMDNLQDRAFALARWRLRETVLCCGESPPEFFTPRRERILLVYAYGTWIYRLLLFIGIALLVYHMVFKLAGLFLMLVELVWFISRPVWRELREWWIRRRTVCWNRNLFLIVLGMSGLIGLTAIPWQDHLHAPALISAQNHIQMFASAPSRITQIAVAKNQIVTTGDLLLILAAPDLQHTVDQLTIQIAALQWEIDHATTQPVARENNSVLQKEMVALLTERQGYQQRMTQLRITAPFSGTVIDLEEGLVPGRWVTPTTPLLELVDLQQFRVEAFVSEADVARIPPQTHGIFKPDNLDLSPFAIQLAGVDHAALSCLPKPYLASSYGGPIAVWKNKQNMLVPFDAIYRLTLDMTDRPDKNVYELPGTIKILAEKKSLFRTVWTMVTSVWIRESGF